MNCASMNNEKSRMSAENARLRRALKQLRESRRRVEEELRRERSRVKEVEKAYEEERQKRAELEKKLAEIERQRDRYRDMIFKPKRVKGIEEELPESEDEATDKEWLGRMKRSKKRKRGGQRGHRGYGRYRPMRIDEEKRVYLERCPICESHLQRSKTIKCHTVEDIPALEESRPKVVRYNTEVQWCPQCKKVVRGKANGVIPRCRLGVNVLLYVLIHKYISRESWETLVNNLSNWYGLKVSKGNLIGMMHRARNWLGYKYDDILEQIRSANIKYADETSWRVNGMNNWLWGFFTDQYAYYTIEESRGKGIAEKILKGSHPEDVLVRDDYGGYMKLPFQHQSCWAHLLRESHERACRPNSSNEIQQLHKKLKSMFSSLQEIVQQPFRLEKRKMLYKLYKMDIQHIIDADYFHDDVKEIQKRIGNQKTNLITALLHENVPLTNNYSERNIRNFVVTRKISGGSRSNAGAKTIAVLMSIMQSTRLQNLAFLPTMKKYLLDSLLSKTE